ncbi:MAG: hypothetical protein HUU10_14535 [Bacteroidetes bacterium]|nr:hypothetical protein [Bacteroidota bacterium]
MKTIVILFLSIFTLIGCSDENNQEEITNDNLLKNRLVELLGTGKSPTIEYRSNNTYKQTFFHSESNDSNSNKLWMIVEGKYSINNAELKIENGTVVYIDSLVSYFGWQIIFTHEIELKLSGNQLLMTPVKVFTSETGSKTELWGRWSHTSWTISYRNQIIIYEGRQTETYTFNKDSSQIYFSFDYSEKNIFDPYSGKSDFIYNPPLLSIDATTENIQNVTFKNGKMYWYYDLKPNILGKDYQLNNSEVLQPFSLKTWEN